MVGWFLLLALVCAAIIVICFVVLPKNFLRLRYRIEAPTDRGLKIVREEMGKHIVYEPDREVEPFIKQYVLSERDGKKCLVCRIEEDVRFLDYEIVLFNNEGKSFKGLRIKEQIERPGYTRVVELPDETCYVSLLLNRADDFRIDNRESRRVSKSWLALFFVLCIVVEALGFWGIYVSVAHLFGGLYVESFLVSVPNQTEFIVFGAVIVAVNLLTAWIFVKKQKSN